MKYPVLCLLSVAVAAAMPAAVLDAPLDNVSVAAQSVLSAMGLPLDETATSGVATLLVETKPAVLQDYIEDSPAFGKPAWTKARLQVTLLLSQADGNRTRVEQVILLERFGVASGLVFIPPAWTQARSNGRLESELLAAVARRLATGDLAVEPVELVTATFSGWTAPASDDPPFIPNVAASKDPFVGNQNETTLGVFGGQFLVGGWNDNRTGVYHVGFNRSSDGGLTWQTTDTLMDVPSYEEDGDPVLCVDDSGVVYYFWLAFNRSSMTGDIHLTKSYDHGATWGPMLNLTPGTPSSLDDKPWATIDGNNVFLTWYDYGSSNGLMYKRSTDRGATWGTAMQVGSGGNGTCPFRGLDSTVFVGWGFQDIKLSKSTDMGRTWQGQRTVISCPWSPRSTPFRINNIPSFATSRDRTVQYVAFCDSRNRSGQLDVFVSRSTDQGANWGTPVKVNDTGSGDTTLQFYPWLSVDPYDRLHVAWHDTRTGGNVIGQYYAYSTDQGSTWSQNYRVSDTACLTSDFIGDYNACQSDDQRVYVLWCDARTGPNNPDALFSRAQHIAPQPIDAGVAAIVAPAGTVDSGATVTPQSRVRNYGSQNADIPVRFRILRQGSPVYDDSANVNLNGGDSAVVSFDQWTATPVDSIRLVSWTLLPGDVNPTNDTARANAYVRSRSHDVGAVRILAPTGQADSGAAITPQAIVTNYGSFAESFNARMRIGTGYNQTAAVSLAVGQTDTADFPVWYAWPANILSVRCSTELSGDASPGNDLALDSVEVIGPLHDVGVVRIVAPTDTVEWAELVMPKALVRNVGTRAETFEVWFHIGANWSAADTMTLAIGQTDTARFVSWIAAPAGLLVTRCTTALAGDMNPANNLQTGSVVVTPNPGVVEAGSLPVSLCLERARPSPAAGRVSVRFGLPSAGEVELVLYDASGRQVSALARGLHGRGWHDVRLDAARLAAGIYWLKFRARDFTQTQKLVVQR